MDTKNFNTFHPHSPNVNIKPHTPLRGLKHNWCTLGPRKTTETETELFECLSVEVRVSSGLPQGQGLWVQQTWVWHKPSWRRLPLTPPQSCQNLHRTAEIGSWRAQTEPCVHQDQEKGAVTVQETALDMHVGVREFLAEAWVGGGLWQGWGH